MTRNIGFIILALVVALLAIVSLSERHQNQNLPLIRTAAHVQAPMLFSPCPVVRRNFPRANPERSA